MDLILPFFGPEGLSAARDLGLTSAIAFGAARRLAKKPGVYKACATAINRRTGRKVRRCVIG